MDTIAGFAERLWKDLVGSGNKQDGSLPHSITHVALGFSGVESGEAGQQSIEGFFQPGTSTGDPILADRKRRRVAVEDSAGASVDLSDLSGTSQIDRGEKAMMAFVCPRCHQRIELEPTNDAHNDNEALSRLRIEHSDFHLAEDLSKMAGHSDGNVGSGSVRIRAVEKVNSTKMKRKKQPPEDGIAKFFARK